MSKNQALFERAQRTIPGGVNSPVRAFRSVGGTPRFIERAEGAYFWDADGKRYIDYIGSWGPMILGHVHPEVLGAVQRVLANGFSFGAPTEAEIEIAEEICKLVPSIEQVRMVSSGTEATMSALRLARGFTNRSRIVKFEGCYHGHADSLLVKAGSGLLTFGNPTSAGVPADTKLMETPGGRLGELVADEARSWEADLVVVGTHGRHGVSRVLLGSGAEQVLRLAPVPVLAVRSGEPPAR